MISGRQRWTYDWLIGEQVSLCVFACTELANKLQEEQEDMKGSIDLDVQPHISADPDESQGELSPPNETLDCDSLNHASTDYITWNGTHSFSDKRPLKVHF